MNSAPTDSFAVTRRENPAKPVNSILTVGTELLILFDGRVLVHNLTPEMDALLQTAMHAGTTPGARSPAMGCHPHPQPQSCQPGYELPD